MPRNEFTGPTVGAASNRRWNSSATATVGSTTGKNTIVRMMPDPLRSQKTYIRESR